MAAGTLELKQGAPVAAVARPHFRSERAAFKRYGAPVAGIDEAGRGPWAGPVVAAAVMLDPRDIPDGIDDSKRMSPAARARLYDQLIVRARCGVGIATVQRIDRDNILAATLWAMAQAVRSLPVAPVIVLVDGNRAPPVDCAVETIVGGDAKSLSIAAASIIAKVTRDRLMADYAVAFPDYGFDRHKGYGTDDHAAALERFGVTPIHRRSFKPVADALARVAEST